MENQVRLFIVAVWDQDVSVTIGTPPSIMTKELNTQDKQFYFLFFWVNSNQEL